MKRVLKLSSTCIAAASMCPAGAGAFTYSSRGPLLPGGGRPSDAPSSSVDFRSPAPSEPVVHAAAPGRRRARRSPPALASSVFGGDDPQFLKGSLPKKGDAPVVGSTSTASPPPPPSSSLSAAAFDSLERGASDEGREGGLLSGAGEYADVISAALLITGNTVGASMMVLPSVAAGPGMLPSSGLFLALYGVNLVSGLLLAEVAIGQKESSGVDAPSSLKEFAAFNLGSENAAGFVSAVSIFVNSCILTFDLTRAGQLASGGPLGGLTGLGPQECTALAATALVGLVATQTDRDLSRFASATVGVLFASFAGFLLPGLAGVHDPAAALFAPGTGSSDVAGSLSAAAPIFLTTCVYQNIVPSVTKILGYDRSKTTAAVVIGSLLPVCMYLAFCFAALGGGLDTSAAGGGPFFAAFASASLTGSAVATLMSLSEEYSNNLPWNSSNNMQAETKVSEEASTSEQEGEVASVPSVVLAGLVPVLVGLAFANGEATAALSTAGSYGSPLLYGVLPVAMAWNLRGDRGRTSQDGYSSTAGEEDLVPGGSWSLALLGMGAFAFIAQNLERDISGVLSSSGLM
eukprot:CAMPEP_0113580864 /NCGR_PEP_ID=MMETSP0015_2-20120614/30933_1 /TAXON_ID=2838 /ORGANISM="Odontella" /LENGTH=574 /DNA_ID=CAMNT_0000485147 /DNA_START=65 /DNA_END=1789 /DNA_ORIENTATION=- /assembly_acc=CAM_ASM_000160